MSFYVGQRVVCIRDGWSGFFGEIFPVCGCIYTIRDIEPGVLDPSHLFLRFEEIVNEPAHYASGFVEANFDAEEFRPVRDTDISIFTALLTPQPQNVEA